MNGIKFIFLQSDSINSLNIFEILKDLFREFALAIPNVLAAIVVAVLGWIIAKIIARVLKKVLYKIGVDKLAEKLNEIDIVRKTNIRIEPSTLLSKVVYYILLLIFFIAATDILGMPAVSQLMSDILNYVPSLISALIVFVLGILLSEFIKNIVHTTCKSLGIPAAKMIANFVFYFLFLTVAMSALAQAGFDTNFITSNLTVILGGGVLAFAFGYGFASKDLVANFLASFYSKDKVQIGDIIRIEEAKGKVVAIDKTSLTLQTEEKQIIIPLSKLTSEKIEIFNS